MFLVKKFVHGQWSSWFFKVVSYLKSLNKQGFNEVEIGFLNGIVFNFKITSVCFLQRMEDPSVKTQLKRK